MGIVRKDSQRSYFVEPFWLLETNGFSLVFSRTQYELLQSFMHFSDNENVDKDDRLSKIRPVLDLVTDKYLQCYESNREVSIDEVMLKFKGRLFWKQYMPKEPSKWGIKLWALCDSHTGYLMKFEVYTGKSKEPVTGGLSSNVVNSLMSGFENSGMYVFTGNFYSSPELFEHLRIKGLGALATVRTSRKGLPHMNMKIKHGESPIMWVNRDKTMLSCSWQDTAKVNMISTIGNTDLTHTEVHSKKSAKNTRKVTKPNLAVTYNKFMGGVDKFDQFCSSYPYDRKCMKWYKVLWHFCIEAALVNSLICYNIANPTKKLRPNSFRQKVIDGLLQGFAKRTVKKGRRSRKSYPLHKNISEGQHFLRQHNKGHLPNCVVCSIMPSKCKKKGLGNAKESKHLTIVMFVQDNHQCVLSRALRITMQRKSSKRHANATDFLLIFLL